jgi:hypothetical protein
VIAKSIAAGTVVFFILQAQRHDNSALAAAAATVTIGTFAGLVAFASTDPSKAHTFTRSAVLAVPAWGRVHGLHVLLTRVLDWRLAVGADSLSGWARRCSTST